jgi:1D-myo-inositol-tetrakisphosphate 5-kinase/inositol-polyphosphate multikinase
MLLESYSSHAIRAKLLVRVLSLLDEHLAVLETVLKPLEARFTGSSVLVVYEGDPDRLADAMDKWDTRPRHSLFATALNAALEEDEEDESDLEEDSTSSEDDSLDGTRADARVKRRCPPLTVRLIDFAHTRLVEGEGPDLGVLKGLSTLRALVQGRKKEAEACLTEVGSVTT